MLARAEVFMAAVVIVSPRLFNILLRVEVGAGNFWYKATESLVEMLTPIFSRTPKPSS
jgi:hypothetical protein